MRLDRGYFYDDAVTLAQDLIGKIIVRKFDDGTDFRAQITETEAYCGQEDLACHASNGRTKRTEIMYGEGGYVYVYLIYGMYWMLNFVCGEANEPQAVLVRGVENISGPGRLGKALQLDKSFYGEDIELSSRIWLEESNYENSIQIQKSKRIGIDYAGEEWANKLWRFFI